MKKLAIFSIALSVFFSCKPHEKNDIELGPLPSPSFNVEKIDENRFKFTNTTEGAFARWEFGNGEVSDQEVDTAYYPFEGTFTAKLTVYGKGGRASTTKDVVVSVSDPTICDNTIYQLLTGGCSATEGKSWVLDREAGGITQGAVDTTSATQGGWWVSAKDEFAGTGCMYATDYNFKLKYYQYKQINNGTFHVNWEWASKKYNKPAADICMELPLNVSSWVLEKNANNRNVINFSNGDFIGIYNGRSKYEIMKLTEDTLIVRSAFGYDSEVGYNYYRLLVKR